MSAYKCRKQADAAYQGWRCTSTFTCKAAFLAAAGVRGYGTTVRDLCGTIHDWVFMRSVLIDLAYM